MNSAQLCLLLNMHCFPLHLPLNDLLYVTVYLNPHTPLLIRTPRQYFLRRSKFFEKKPTRLGEVLDAQSMKPFAKV